jgi:CHAD domain-containing protein
MLHGVAEGDVRSVHRARVATRRLRELLPVVPSGGEAASKLRRHLRDVTRRLGTLRELDVTALLVHELRASHPDHRAALEMVAASLDEDRRAARQSVTTKRATLERERVARRLQELVDDSRPAADPAGAAARRWTWAVNARVVARAERLKRAMADAGAVYLPERLHEVRIALKKLRYALELLVELGGAAQGDLEVLRDKQDVLGRMHDLQILMARARRLEASRETGPAVSPALAALVDALEDDCRGLHARYIGDRAALEALASRLGVRARESHAAGRELRKVSG